MELLSSCRLQIVDERRMVDSAEEREDGGLTRYVDGAKTAFVEDKTTIKEALGGFLSFRISESVLSVTVYP